MLNRTRTSIKKWRSPDKNYGVENTMHKVENTLEEFNSRLDKATEEKSGILKHGVEITKEEQQKGKN